MLEQILILSSAHESKVCRSGFYIPWFRVNMVPKVRLSFFCNFLFLEIKLTRLCHLIDVPQVVKITGKKFKI